MYDFANSGYTTVVLTAVFNAYFVSVIAGNAPWATFAWTAALSVSYAIVMFLGPVAGAWADAHAAKKKVLLVSTVVCIIGTTALNWTREGAVAAAVSHHRLERRLRDGREPLRRIPAGALASRSIERSGVGMEPGLLRRNPGTRNLARRVMTAESRGSTTSDAVGGTMIITAAVFALAAAPTFIWLKERAAPPPRRACPRRSALLQTAHEARRHRDLLLVSRAASSTRRVSRP